MIREVSHVCVKTIFFDIREYIEIAVFEVSRIVCIHQSTSSKILESPQYFIN